LNVSATNIMSKCRFASIELDDAMILARVANPDGSNFRKGQVRATERHREFIAHLATEPTRLREA
jgi:hypothetical protein